jgi:Caspase domain/TIR domain
MNAHALLIQLASYPDAPLPAVHDAADIAAVLKEPALCGFPPSQVRLLHDREGTREAILVALRALVAAADSDSIVLLYFSGHGYQFEDESYLVPIDMDSGALAESCISARELAQILAPLTARKVLLIFDCCHAGGMRAKDVEKQRLRPGFSAAAQDALVQGRGWALLAAADADEASWVVPGARNGIFTKHLLDGLRGARPSDDGYVRVFNLFEYVQPRVTQEEGRQHPIFKCQLDQNFAIARHRGGVVERIERTEDGFLYHALLSYARADGAFVRTVLLPRLRAAGLRVATCSSVGEPGLDRVFSLERGLQQARRTLVILTPAYLRRETTDDKYADFLSLQRKHADITSGRYSLIPIYLEDLESLKEPPLWLTSLGGVQLAAPSSSPSDFEEEMDRLLRTLVRPVPQR